MEVGKAVAKKKKGGAKACKCGKCGNSGKCQRELETVIGKIKTEADEMKLYADSSNFNFGKDPSKGCKFGKRKSLPRVCSYLIKKYLCPQYIAKDYDLDYCVKGRGKVCCYDLHQHTFGHLSNLLSLISMQCTKDHRNKDQISRMVGKALLKEIIDEKTSNCILKVVVNDEQHRFYLKRVGQAALGKSLDISQITHRMSYGPEILIKVGNDIFMRMRCKDSVIGIGVCDLLKSELNIQNESDSLIPTTDSIHSMIHICNSFDIMSTIQIGFCYKDEEIRKISIQIVGDHLEEPLHLYNYPKNNKSNCDKNDNSTNSAITMPIIGNIYSNNNNQQQAQEEIPPPLKKRKLK